MLVTGLVEKSWSQKGGAEGAMRNRGEGGVGGEEEVEAITRKQMTMVS